MKLFDFNDQHPWRPLDGSIPGHRLKKYSKALAMSVIMIIAIGNDKFNVALRTI